MSSLYRQISEKQKILHDRYGGLMTLTELAREIRMGRDRAKRWGEENGVGVGGFGARIKYDTDEVAKIIVQRRGMC